MILTLVTVGSKTGGTQPSHQDPGSTRRELRGHTPTLDLISKEVDMGRVTIINDFPFISVFLHAYRRRRPSWPK